MQVPDHGTADLGEQMVQRVRVGMLPAQTAGWTPGKLRRTVRRRKTMDASRFDALSREVGTRTDRRGLLKTLVGGMLGVGGLAAASDAALGKQECDEG